MENVFCDSSTKTALERGTLFKENSQINKKIVPNFSNADRVLEGILLVEARIIVYQVATYRFDPINKAFYRLLR